MALTQPFNINTLSIYSKITYKKSLVTKKQHDNVNTHFTLQDVIKELT